MKERKQECPQFKRQMPGNVWVSEQPILAAIWRTAATNIVGVLVISRFMQETYKALDQERIVLELFGGAHAQLPGATNVDIIAESGIPGSATRLVLPNNSVDEILANNPYMTGGGIIFEWLEEASRVLKPGGEIIINATKENKFGMLKASQMAQLESLGLMLEVNQSPLLNRFRDLNFTRTDGKPIPHESVLSIVLRKVP